MVHSSCDQLNKCVFIFLFLDLHSNDCMHNIMLFNGPFVVSFLFEAPCFSQTLGYVHGLPHKNVGSN